MTGVPLEPVFVGWYADGSTRHVCHAFTTTYAGEITHQAAEVAWGGWMTPAELTDAARLADATGLARSSPDGRGASSRRSR